MFYVFTWEFLDPEGLNERATVDQNFLKANVQPTVTVGPQSPEWGWQRRKLSRWGGSCPTGLGGAERARTYPVLPDKGEPLPTCSHPPPKSEGVSKLIRPIKPTGVFGACMRKKQGSRNSPKGGLRETAADRWRPSENREAPLGKLRERSRSCGNVPEVAATFAGALTADPGHGGSDHHSRSVSCRALGAS